jgi:hypothetical protein
VRWEHHDRGNSQQFPRIPDGVHVADGAGWLEAAVNEAVTAGYRSPPWLPKNMFAKR